MFCYSCGSVGQDQKSCTVPLQIIIFPVGHKAWKFEPWLKAEARKESFFQVATLIPESLVEATAQALKDCPITDPRKSGLEKEAGKDKAINMVPANRNSLGLEQLAIEEPNETPLPLNIISGNQHRKDNSLHVI